MDQTITGIIVFYPKVTASSFFMTNKEAAEQFDQHSSIMQKFIDVGYYLICLPHREIKKTYTEIWTFDKTSKYVSLCIDTKLYNGDEPSMLLNSVANSFLKSHPRLFGALNDRKLSMTFRESKDRHTHIAVY